MIFTAAFFTVLAASVVYALVSLALTVENRRFWKQKFAQPAVAAKHNPRCLLVVPCKGIEFQLRENLLAFLAQDYANFEIRFVVESGRDPAVRLIRNLIRENRRVESELVIAGPCENSGQKVRNLRAATAELDHEIEVLVFADSDAACGNRWLQNLVSGIGEKNLGARTGYRWMVPRDRRLATLVGCSINNAVASMLGPGKHFLVWGGSWAIHRAVFDAVSMRQAWSGCLSDDLVATRVLSFSELSVKFEPRCVCTSHVSFTWNSLQEFLTRQLVIARNYAPFYWSWAIAVTLVSQTGFWAALIGGTVLTATGNAAGQWLIATALGMYALAIIRGVLRQTNGRLVSEVWQQAKAARRFDTFGSLISGPVLAWSFLRSVVSNRIVWRDIAYLIGKGGRITLLGRRIRKHPWLLDRESAEPDHAEPEHVAPERNQHDAADTLAIPKMRQDQNRQQKKAA